jgi:Sec-independent protein translocase protein TatA
MGFGTEMLLIMLLGFVVLGPERLHAMLGHVARAKAELEHAARGIKSQLATELPAEPQDGSIDALPDLAGKQ